MTMLKLLATIVSISLVSRLASAADRTKTINLENYNGWNLPFAKSFVISGTDESTEDFSTGTYLLELDPAAFFSIIYIDSSLYELEDPITLNYTWYGDNGFSIQGKWVDVNMKFTLEDETDILVPLTVFVSYMNSPESGVQGSLGLAHSRYNPKMNFLTQLGRATSGFPLANYQFMFTADDGSDLNSQYSGYLVLSDEPVKANMTDFFTAGTVNIDEQIRENGFSELATLDTSVVINPFLSLYMANITLGSPEIQESQVFFTSFGQEVYLTPQTQGIHLPNSIFEYISDNFFEWICQDMDDFTAQQKEFQETSQSYLMLSECQCKGRDFSGMPSIQLLFNRDEASSDTDSNMYYSFEPAEFELFPKVSKLLRTTYCNLGLWNIDNQYPNITQSTDASHNWALGQVFIRRNGLNVQWVLDGDDYVAIFSFKTATDTQNLTLGWVLAIGCSVAMVIYVTLLTRMKFRRIREQNEEFKKIKILTSNFKVEIMPEFAEVFKAQQADRDFIQGKEGAITSAQLNIEKLVKETAMRSAETPHGSKTILFDSLDQPEDNRRSHTIMAKKPKTRMKED